MTFYKIVRVIKGKMCSFTPTMSEYHCAVYEEGEWIKPKPSMLKLRYGLCVFGNASQVEGFLGRNVAHIGSTKVYECEIGKRWYPNQENINFISGFYRTFKAFKRKLNLFSWGRISTGSVFPVGTIMTDKLLLVKDVTDQFEHCLWRG